MYECSLIPPLLDKRKLRCRPIVTDKKKPRGSCESQVAKCSSCERVSTRGAKQPLYADEPPSASQRMACSNYRVNTAGAKFGDCVCGFPKSAHAIAGASSADRERQDRVKNAAALKITRSATMSKALGKKAKQAGSGVGATVWIRDDDEAFVRAEVLALLDSGAVRALPVGKTAEVTASKYYDIDPEDAHSPDLVLMLNVDAPNILHTLRTRHAQSSPYTNVGLEGIMISVNPFCWIQGLYDEANIRHYFSAQLRASTDLQPHIFAIAASAHRAMLNNGQPQVRAAPGRPAPPKDQRGESPPGHDGTLWAGNHHFGRVGSGQD